MIIIITPGCTGVADASPGSWGASEAARGVFIHDLVNWKFV